MSSLGVSTTVEQHDRHSNLVFRAVTSRRLAGLVFQTQVSELQASAEGIMATGDLGGYKLGILHLRWDRIRELHFAPSGLAEVGGLYAREGLLCSRCILPRIGETQANQVVTALAVRFPVLMRLVEVDLEADSPARSLLGHRDKSPILSDLLSQRPTSQPRSLSHILNRVTRSMIGREHESARRIHRGTARPL